jgi:hypothetical protein
MNLRIMLGTELRDIPFYLTIASYSSIVTSMPRSARLDMAGLLQYVNVRDIEKRDIFIED